jgi:hypothetical protein
VDDLALVLHPAPAGHIPADRITRRCRASSDGRTIRFATFVSSSKVMNITPFAAPGFYRTSTSPAALTRRPSRALLSSAQGTIRRSVRSALRKASGCQRRLRPFQR